MFASVSSTTNTSDGVWTVIKSLETIFKSYGFKCLNHYLANLAMLPNWLNDRLRCQALIQNAKSPDSRNDLSGLF